MSFCEKANVLNELSRDYISLGTILQKRKAHDAMLATWALSPKFPSDFEYISFASPPFLSD